jgi:hypothetical protein
MLVWKGWKADRQTRTVSNFLRKFFTVLFMFAALANLTACGDNHETATMELKEAVVAKAGTNAEGDNNQSPNSEPAKEPITNIYFTRLFDNANSIPQESFHCEDKIFAVIEFNHFPAKLQQIEVIWKDPNDEVREHNRFPYFTQENQSFAWASLQLHRSVGAGMLQWINPAAGLEEFIGTWTVTIKIQDVLEEEKKIEVLC